MHIYRKLYWQYAEHKNSGIHHLVIKSKYFWTLLGYIKEITGGYNIFVNSCYGSPPFKSSYIFLKHCKNLKAAKNNLLKIFDRRPEELREKVKEDVKEDIINTLLLDTDIII